MDDKLQIVLDIIDAKITKWDTTSQGAWSDDKRRLCTKIARELREIKAEVIATFPAPQPSASAEPWQVRYRPDLTGKTWEVFKSDERYTIDLFAHNGLVVYHCGCGRYTCQHIDALKAYNAPEFSTAFEWREDHPDGKNWYPKVTK